VLKRPLPTLSEEAQLKWLEKQHRTKPIIEEIHAKQNPSYNIPRMHFINGDEMQILEERAPGYHLTKEFYRALSGRQKYVIRDGIANFLVDMNELRPAKAPEIHRISDELKFERFENFLENKMGIWFTKNDVRYMGRIKKEIKNFEYTTLRVWSHCDLNSGNVLFDPRTNKLSFIDFAEADYNFIYRDIFGPVQVGLGIGKHVYEIYSKLHDKSKYPIIGIKNYMMQNIMRYRTLAVYLKRFTKASDDLRASPQSPKGEANNKEKIAFMKEVIDALKAIEKQF
jgi:hypothetical protein